MKWRGLILVALVVAAAATATATADEKDDANKKALEALQGTWQVKSGTQDGTPGPAEEAGKVRLVIAGNAVTSYMGEEIRSEGTITVDATKKPATIDLEAEIGQRLYTREEFLLLLAGAVSGATRAPAAERAGHAQGFS
jgi:uncharacterized protein (TIGR03067 family)